MMEPNSAQPLPFSDWCFLCGSENPRGLHGRFYREGSRARLVVTPDSQFNGYRGVLHGGVSAGLLDETMGWAAALAINRMCVTAELSIRYIEQVPVERTLMVVAEPVRAGRRLCTVEGELWLVESSPAGHTDDGDTLLAQARGKFVPLSWEETLEIDRCLIYEPGMSRVFKSGNQVPQR